ncbi:MAG: FadR family transcriptional regulator [Trueperaceae bacterium]|nr:MAG: FadR family transcriptional regulator [Trueperaceae bacterium]
MAKPLEKLTRAPLVFQSVQEAIKGYIHENSLKPGDSLISETELARQLGVSRNSVREAVKALESMGILETRRGSGVYVRAFSFEPLLDNLPYGLMGDLRDLKDLLEIRRILELAKVDAAIEALDDTQLSAFQAVLATMKEKAERGEGFPDEDRRFHRLLFENLGNRMLLRLIDIFWLASSKASQHVNIADPRPMRTYCDHVAIVDALRSGDVEGARAALDRHYDGIYGRLRQLDTAEGGDS